MSVLREVGGHYPDRKRLRNLFWLWRAHALLRLSGSRPADRPSCPAATMSSWTIAQPDRRLSIIAPRLGRRTASGRGTPMRTKGATPGGKLELWSVIRPRIGAAVVDRRLP
jgi:hypothetical protein